MNTGLISLNSYFMGFHGQADIDTVIKTMSDAVERHAVRQIVLGCRSSHLVDLYLVPSLRGFALLRDVHVSLVVHPRKLRIVH